MAADTRINDCSRRGGRGIFSGYRTAVQSTCYRLVLNDLCEGKVLSDLRYLDGGAIADRSLGHEDDVPEFLDGQSLKVRPKYTP